MVKYCSQCGTRIKDGGKYCTNCGAELDYNVVINNTNNTISTEVQANLQNNGVQQNNNIQKENNQAKDSTHGFAIASFVCSLCGILFSRITLGIIPLDYVVDKDLGILFARITLGIIAICFSIAAKKQLKINNQKGKGLATAGLVIGIIDISIALVYYFIIFIFFMTTFTSEYIVL